MRCRLGNCERVCQASRVESLDGDRQALEQESCFSRISRRIRQAPSDLRQEFLGTDTHAAKCFQGRWNEIVGPAERAVLGCLSGSCSLSGTGTGDGALLEIGVPQSVDYLFIYFCIRFIHTTQPGHPSVGIGALSTSESSDVNRHTAMH